MTPELGYMPVGYTLGYTSTCVRGSVAREYM